ncbi:MAG: hypothetical protein H6603_08260 [Flavobacteriales bacterium]|nr:hypothetical protein [Flavobacteriales bacterium]
MNKGVKVITLYLLFFLTYFVQYPINGSLPGNLDTWWFIHVFEQLNFAKLFEDSQHSGIAGYPDGNLLLLGDFSLATSFIFNLIHLLIANKIIAYYILVSLIFSLNSFSMFVLGKHFFYRIGVRFYTGFVFGAGPFFIGGIDNLGAFTVYPAVLGLHFFLNCLQRQNIGDLLGFTSFAILQIFSGYYFFVLGGLICLILFLEKSVRQKEMPLSGPMVLASVVALCVFISFSMLYHHKISELSAVNPIDVFNEETIRLLPRDLFRPHSNNLIYKQVPVRENFEVLNGIHSLFMGWLVWILAFVAIVKSQSNYKFILVLLLIAGVVIAFGASVEIFGTTFKMPMYYVFKYLDSGVIRVSIQAYFISHLALCILAGLGFSTVMTYVKTPILYIVFPVIFVVECLAFPLPSYNSQPYLNISNEYQRVIDRHSNRSIQTILDLPSSLYSDVCLNDDLYPYSIDFIYTNWQTQHHHNILNGRAGFIPFNRLVVDSLVQNLDSSESMSKLISDYGLTMISVHKWLMCEKSGMNKFGYLQEKTELQVVLDSDSLLVLTVKD